MDTEILKVSIKTCTKCQYVDTFDSGAHSTHSELPRT
jgi:hypothetical protein